MAPRLELDFAAEPERSGARLRRGLLAALLVVLMVLLAWPVPPDKAPARPAAAPPRTPAASAEELKLARTAFEQLMLPWAELIDRLEQAVQPGVALLALQPDAASGVLRIRAEADDADALFAYLHRLRGAGLADVHLVSYEAAPQGARFQAQASFRRAAPPIAPPPALFQARLPEAGALTGQLEQMHRLALASEARLTRGEYRLEARGPALLAYRVTLPMRGSYTALRGFIGKVLAEMPAVSLDAVRFEREGAGEAEVQADLRLTVHLRRASGPGAQEAGT